MFHQELKICHWWFFVDCASSVDLYKMAPAPTSRPRNRTEENFRLRRNFQSNQYSYDFDIGSHRNSVDIGRNRNNFDIGRQRNILDKERSIDIGRGRNRNFVNRRNRNRLERRRGDFVRRRKQSFGRKTKIEDEMKAIRNKIYDILSYFR